ncbi:uncharacterized protein LOC126849269 [Cataglyphis hispanica]|uniref:uncharacterized protein LOC126849269 n=1 Tax=Cataglyphis hispanica TaxID=1086592 RepID=UPI002180331E|nr:uncharacterized protein LOC126849269 [Cataglyphis hispanica]
MRLLCLSLALAIIYSMAIMRGPRVEARATTTPDTSSSSSSSSSESWEVPAKPATPQQTVEAFALGIPTILGGLYWTELAFQTMYNNSMHIADKIKSNPWLAETVQEYINKSLTW